MSIRIVSQTACMKCEIVDGEMESDLRLSLSRLGLTSMAGEKDWHGAPSLGSGAHSRPGMEISPFTRYGNGLLTLRKSLQAGGGSD
jgi:hypothetical protein